MRMVDIIEKKVAGQALTDLEIREMITAFVDGSIPDYQMTAFMMAVVFQGMTYEEAAALTLAMMHSGDTVDLSDLPGVKVDKHSSGGVGDTTTLAVAPLVAACGGTVAKMSGRGLSFTGGTLDKLESIPGTNVEQPIDRFKEIVRTTGVAVIGQSGNLDPADKKMYALRDVTSTVMSIPLIASSIMSKKLAAGADAIVLDIKVGTGAFIKTVEQARELANLMCGIGSHLGRRVTAVISDMSQPLGMAVGNALEVREAVELLTGKVREGDPLYEVCMILGSEMLLLSNLADSPEKARKMLQKAIADGEGIRRLRAMVSGMGGDASYLTEDGMEKLCSAKRKIDLCAEKEGCITGMITEKIGMTAQLLGAGRAKKSDVIDPAVGLVMHKRVNDRVEKGEALCTFYVNDEGNLNAAETLFRSAIQIGPEKGSPIPLVHDIIRS